jgi:integrase
VSLYTRKHSPYWWIDLLPTDGGPRIQRSTKIRHDAPTPGLRAENKRLAETVLHEAYTNAVRRREGLDPPATQTETFVSFADWYESHISAHKRSKDRELELLKALTVYFRKHRLTAITRDVVVEWMTWRRAQVSAATVNRELDTLKSVLAAAVPKYLKASPIAGLKRLRVTKRAIVVLSRADEKKLLVALAPADAAIIIAALDTLIRASDLLRLDWSHDKGAYLEVPDPKTGKGYKVPISTRLRAALDRLKGKKKKPTGPIFRHRRIAKTPRLWTHTLAQMLEYGCARAGVTYGRGQGGITFHGLRHTGASRMVEAGVSLRVLQAIGGWSDLRQLTRYTHPTEPAMRAAVNAVSRPVSHRKANRGHSRAL